MVVRGVLALFALMCVSAPLLADRDAGRDVFMSAGCVACHSFGCNRGGPKLDGLLGRRAGSVADFEYYSEEMKASGVTWTEETLDAYLADPATFMPGNGMASAAGKIDDETQRHDLIDFLKEPDDSIDICS